LVEGPPAVKGRCQKGAAEGRSNPPDRSYALRPRVRDAERVADNLGQITHQTFDRSSDAADVLRDAVNLTLDAIETSFHRGQIVGVAARPFQNMARDKLLTLNLALEDTDPPLKFFPGHIRSHNDPPEKHDSTNCWGPRLERRSFPIEAIVALTL